MAMVGSRISCFSRLRDAEGYGAQQRGGQATGPAVLPAESEDVQRESAKDIAALLAQTINQARKGQIAPKVAGTIGYLASSLMKVLETSDLEERLAKVEKALKTRGPEESLIQSRRGLGFRMGADRNRKRLEKIGELAQAEGARRFVD